MKKQLRYLLLLLLCVLTQAPALAWPGMPLPRLHVDGRYFKDNNGNIVNLHGFAQTYSPWFNEENSKWNNYDVQACLAYNQEKIDQILAAGWKMSFVRQHMDPYWSNEPGIQTTGENDISAFRMERFKKYLDEVFVPMALYAVDKGLYVVMRPPGVCPEYISVGGEYHKYLLSVWEVVAQHPKLRNHPNIMFELANEPIKIKAADGTDGGFKEMHDFFQQIVDMMRQYCDNIILVPGLAYQANYTGYADYPITGQDIGYAVHCYPGWFNSGTEENQNMTYEEFQKGWDEQIGPVSDFAPIIVTEMDWAPAKYDSSWGKSITGVTGGIGFGANFKYIADNTGNVSWMIFTSTHLLINFADTPGTEGAYTFLNDPEACPWPVYHWLLEYAGEAPIQGELIGLTLTGITGNELDIRMGDSQYAIVNALYADGSSRPVTIQSNIQSSNPDILEIKKSGEMHAKKIGTATVTISYTSEQNEEKTLKLNVNVITPFPLTESMFNPSIWEQGTFDEESHILTTGQYGFGGWEYANGLDLSKYKTLTVELGSDNDSDISFRLFDKNNYWSNPATYDFGNSRRIVIDLHNMKDQTGASINPSHLYIIGFWSMGNKPFIIKQVILE